MSNQPQAPPPVTAAATVKPVELWLGQPLAFDGETAKARTWLNMVQIYLHVNKDIYNTEEKRVAFVFSFMTKGAAALWTTTFVNKALATGTPNFGAFANFCTEFKQSFIQENAKDQAIAWLFTTQVSKTLPLREYISQFPIFKQICKRLTLMGWSMCLLRCCL